MEKETSVRNNNNINNICSSVREKSGGGRENGSLVLKATSDTIRHTPASDFVLQWGNRKRLRCMKVQVKDDSSTPVQRTTVRVDRRVVRTDRDSISTIPYPNLRQRPSSPQRIPRYYYYYTFFPRSFFFLRQY